MMRHALVNSIIAADGRDNLIHTQRAAAFDKYQVVLVNCAFD